MIFAEILHKLCKNICYLCITMSKFSCIIDNLRAAFASGKTKPLAWRLDQLKSLLNLIKENESAIKDALHKDLRKPAFESDLFEMTVVKNEILHAIKNLSNWIKPTYPNKSLVQYMDTVYMQYEPHGVVLIISAWNYPIQLVFNPLVAALAAGNSVLIKPSEIAPVTADLIAELIPKYLDTDSVQVVHGGPSETTEILQQKFDFIAYTGSSSVGKVVMEAASKHLTPVLLELGGKSPVFVDKDSDLKIVANRIVWGKFTNAGQTCIAPDYVLCEQNVVEKLITMLKSTIKQFYGDLPQQSKDYGKIINSRHFKRLLAVLNGMPSEKIAFGGSYDENANTIEPTIFNNVTLEDVVMKDEIFGPFLPIIGVDGPQQAIDIINKGEKPLALYIFSKTNAVIDTIIDKTSAGGVLVNDTILHAGVTNVPFGGVGNSGMGNYHGQFGFETFSHLKPIWKRKQNLEALIAGRYAPYTDRNLNAMKMLISDSEKGWSCNIL